MLVAALVMLQACAGAQSAGEPTFAQLDGASSAVRRAVVRGAEAVASEDDVVVRARYNPAHCDCPAWEVLLWDRWVRVALVPSREAGSWVDRFASTAFVEGDLLVLTGLREVDERVFAGGWTYPTYQFADLRPDAER